MTKANQEFDIRKKVAEVQIESLAKKVELATQTSDKEIFYYNFSLVAIQLYIINKSYEAVFLKSINISIAELTLLLTLSTLSVFFAIFSTTCLLKSYQLSKLANTNLLDLLTLNKFSIKDQESIETSNKEVGRLYKKADLLCKSNLWLFFGEVVIAVIFLFLKIFSII